MAIPRTIHFLTPTYRPAGGVVKVFDYLVHALELGYEARVHCPEPVADDGPLFAIPRFTGVRAEPRVQFDDSLSVGVGAHDWVLFSWPPHYEQIARGMSPDTPHERVIHLVQNVRHANPAFTNGYALRLLSRPMARIMVAEEVMEACRPHLNRESKSVTIVEGHDWSFFYRLREGEVSAPIRVAYTTWKSEIGTRVEELADERFSFRSIRATATWAQIRDLLHWCDVFLCCPGPEEGFYLPGLEALAAGALLVSPDVGGNRAYCRFGENCLRVGFECAEEYIGALGEFASWESGRVQLMRERGYDMLEDHTLAQERGAFGRLLIELSGRGDRVLIGGMNQQ